MSRIYEEKGHILRILGGDATQVNYFNVQAIQCFNSALGISIASNDKSRQELIATMIEELESNPLLKEKIEKSGKFDMQFLDEEDKREIFGAQTEEAEESDNTTMLVTVGLVAAIGAVGVWHWFKSRN